MAGTKFMQVLESAHYKELTVIAKARGCTLQELIRAVIVPDWLNYTQQPNRPRKNA